MATLVRLAIALWLFLTVVLAVGALIGWYQLRTDPDHRRVSLYLSRILIAESIRAILAFAGIYYASRYLIYTPIYVLLSLFSVILLTGAIWGWLFYLKGIWNGGGWPELLTKLRRSPMDDKQKEQDDEKVKPVPTSTPSTPTSADTGEGDGDDDNDRGGVTDGPGKTP